MTASLSDDMENRDPYRHLLAGVKVGLSTLNSKELVCEPKEAQQQATIGLLFPRKARVFAYREFKTNNISTSQ